MEKLNAEQLENLKYGDTVYRVENGNERTLRFVGKMPSCKEYLIFENGEYLTHLYISNIDNIKTFKGDWYKGDYDFDFFDNLKIEYLQNKIDNIKKSMY
jgi:hypothetical protein